MNKVEGVVTYFHVTLFTSSHLPHLLQTRPVDLWNTSIDRRSALDEPLWLRSVIHCSGLAAPPAFVSLRSRARRLSTGCGENDIKLGTWNRQHRPHRRHRVEDSRSHRHEVPRTRWASSDMSLFLVLSTLPRPETTLKLTHNSVCNKLMCVRVCVGVYM